MRTGAMTAIGARHLARKSSRVLGHIGARGTAYWNVRLLDHLFGFDEIRVHSKRPESREGFAARLERDLGKRVRVTDDWESTVRGADIVVEASRLPKPEPLLKTEWIAKGAFVVPYGTMGAVELSLTDVMDKMVVDDWGQCRKGLPFGALRAHVDSDRLTQENLHAELGQIVAGARPGRERDDETILLWHRGLSTTDIALGHALLRKAEAAGVGQRLRFA
jgi:ornithine cyclodeaminase